MTVNAHNVGDGEAEQKSPWKPLGLPHHDPYEETERGRDCRIHEYVVAKFAGVPDQNVRHSSYGCHEHGSPYAQKGLEYPKHQWHDQRPHDCGREAKGNYGAIDSIEPLLDDVAERRMQVYGRTVFDKRVHAWGLNAVKLKGFIVVQRSESDPIETQPSGTDGDK